MPILKSVQGVALRIEEEDPELEQEKNAKLRKIVKDKFKDRIEI